eukprot:Nitzschia sp. Nitz4//scaffold15_size197535//168//2951//NITZ4_001543-RA/size197535-processed-gene-0.229-mRNA-1//1//CDS//3329537610//8652//frame0
MEGLGTDGYRAWLEKAIRVEDDKDWTPHTVDYASFKRKLRYFSKRRSNLRGLLVQSDNDSISISELEALLGIPPELPVGYATKEAKLLLPTPKAAGRTISEFSRDLYEKTPQESTIDTPYVEFSGDEQQDQRSTDTEKPSMIPLQIETPNPNAMMPGTRFWDSSMVKRRVARRQVSNYERNDVMIFLGTELDGVFMFYMSQWQAISQKLEDIQASIAEKSRRQLGNVTISTEDPQLKKVGQELLELEAFVVTNLVTVRQVLIRYDAFARSFGATPMLNFYMKLVHSSLHSEKFGTDDEEQTGKALTSSLRKMLQHAELDALAESFLSVCENTNNQQLMQPFQTQREEFKGILESSERVETIASSGHAAPLQDTLLQKLRYYFLLGMIEDRLGLEPTYLISRGTSLTKEIQGLAEWRMHGLVRGTFLDDDGDDGEETWSTMGCQKTFNLLLNLAAAFLYCMNYYIVEPSSTMYVNVLGGQDALAGALIGMMPMASFAAAIGYSIWTNNSFRKPFLLSCFLMLSGNLIYSLAHNYKSLTMAFIGRFMTGLGGPKCIVRRYMADTTSLGIRTSVNAAFGMVVAAGSAFGPCCAILLNQLNVSIHLPNGAELWMNNLTGPGYLIALLWFIFSLALVTQFKEPERSGLAEQKKLELKQKASSLRDDDDDGCDPLSPQSATARNTTDDDLGTIWSGATSVGEGDSGLGDDNGSSWVDQLNRYSHLVTFPVRLCLGLLFAKVFVIETLVSSTSTVSKNRYQWQVREVGMLGLSMTYQDRVLLQWLLSIGLVGVLIMIDPTDLVFDGSNHYNDDNMWAVGPHRYVLGYCTIYMAVQTLEGVIGSALSKLIPTALASGTFNSGLLATLVDTLGRTCGDLFISLCGFVDLRQLLNLLFIPGALILTTCLLVVRRYNDLLSV